MNGTRSAAASRRGGGSSFGPGPRRGTDPEGGERSAWKGLTGPSGLNLDHSRIPGVQKMVFDVLTPLVVAVDEPIPLSQFTQKCCDLLLPVLERQAELGAHEFKSQWGRLNEFVCPELARRAGLVDSGYSREHKTVKIDLSVPTSSQPAARRTPPAAAAGPSAAPPGLPVQPPAAAAPSGGAAMTPLPAVHPPAQARAVGMQPQPGQPGLPMPVGLPAGAVPGLAVLPPAPCAYCQGPHSMKNCRDFHAMLQSIYTAGYQQGMAAAAQQMQAQVQAQALPPAPPPAPQ